MATDFRMPELGERYLMDQDVMEVAFISSEEVQLCGVDTHKSYVFTIDQLKKFTANRKIRFMGAAPQTVNPMLILEALSGKQKERQSRRIETINFLIRNFDGKVIPESLKALKAYLSGLSFEMPGRSTIFEWMRKFKESGESLSSLIDQQASFRPRTPRVSAMVQKITMETIQSEYLTKDCNTQVYIHELVESQIRDYNKRLKERILNRECDANEPLLTIPHRTYISRLIRSMSPKHVQHSRLGKNVVKRNFHFGPELYKPETILELAEADSNYLDVHIVDEHGQVIGTPYLTLLMDVCSRCILGWSISFSRPSGVNTLMALKHAMDASRATQIGGTPQCVKMDNGSEFENNFVKDRAKEMHWTPKFVEPGAPNQKAHIERLFGTLNSKLVHMLPGARRQGLNGQGDYDSQAMATLTMAKFKEMFELVVDDYHNSSHSMLPGKKTPYQVFTAQLGDVLPRRYQPNELEIMTRLSFEATISVAGRVKFKNLEWTSGQLQFIRNTPTGKLRSVKVKCLLNVFDLSNILVIDPMNRGNLIRCQSVKPDYQNELTLFMHQEIQKGMRQDMIKTSDSTLTEAKRKYLVSILRAQSAPSNKPSKRRIQTQQRILEGLERGGHGTSAVTQSGANYASKPPIEIQVDPAHAITDEPIEPLELADEQWTQLGTTVKTERRPLKVVSAKGEENV